MEEKYIFELILNKLDNMSYVVPDGEPFTLAINSSDALFEIDVNLIKSIFRKLEKDYGVIEVVEEADISTKDLLDSANVEELQKIYYDKSNNFTLRLNISAFRNYLFDYIGMNGPLLNKDDNTFIVSPEKETSGEKLTLHYKNRKLILNDIFVLANPDFSSENDIVCEELFKNVGKVLTRKDLEEVLKQPLKKDLNKIAEQLGFKKDIRKVFLSVSKTSICLKKTSLSKEDLDNLNIKYLRL